MFELTPCGSGSETVVSGWFAKFFRKEIKSPKYISNFPSHLAKVCYKQLNTDMNYEMYVGLLHSQLQGDCLIPDFGMIVYNRPEVAKVEVYDPYKVESYAF